MNLSFFISRRYFLSKKKKNFINVISLISMIVVAVGTASLIIALSVFNGLEGLLRGMYENFDPDMVVKPAKGKTIRHAEDHLKKINAIDGVANVSKVIEDNVLLRYKNVQRVVRMKGVDRVFETLSGIRNVMITNDFTLVEDSIDYAIIGRGVQYDLSVNLSNDFYLLQLYYPRNIDPGVINPQRMYKVQNIRPSGVFAIEKYYDENYIFVPITFAQALLEYSDKISFYEIYLNENANPATIKRELSTLLGEAYEVLLGEELHSDLYKMLEIEKLFVFLILTAIIGIASINIFFSLTMLVIEKKKDIEILFVQGAGKKLVRNIFLWEGCIVAFTGTTMGLILGLVISLAQQEFGLISMGVNSSIVSSYPVIIDPLDIFLTIITITIITLLASIQPAIKAANSD